MIITEDYFKDLEIEDDDIIVDNPLEQPYDICDINAVNKHLISYYERCLLLVLRYEKDIYALKSHPHIINLLNKVKYFLDTYNIEYEYVFRDKSKGDGNLYLYDVGDFSVISSYYPESSLNYKSNRYYNSVTVVIYMRNIPKFTYKESYYFIHRLYNTLWRLYMNYDSMRITKYKNLYTWNEICDFMRITNKPISLYGDILNDSWKDTSIVLRDRSNRRIIYNLPYEDYFKKALLCFHNTDKDIMIIDDMCSKIKNDIDPFKNSNVR